MGRLSTIRQLPPDVREALDGWLREGAITQTEASGRVNALGRLIADRLPVEVRMHCVAALSGELAKPAPPDRPDEERK